MSPATATLSGAGHGGGALAATRRWAAMLVLPASILPVVLLGPTLLRAPHTLWRQAGAELQRLEASGHAHGVSSAGAARRAHDSGLPGPGQADRSRATGHATGSSRATRATARRGGGLARPARRAQVPNGARRPGKRGRPR